MSERGAKNAYRCEKCGGYVVCVHADEGVTPMFLACRASDGCAGRMASMMYPAEPWPIDSTPGWEWYSPVPEEYGALDAPLALVEPREGMVTVYDHDGTYVGCMGRERWARLLSEDGPAGDVWAAAPQQEATSE